MKLLWEYIKCRRFYALLLLVLDGLFTLMFWLTQADGSAPMYMLLLFTVLEQITAQSQHSADDVFRNDLAECSRNVRDYYVIRNM